MKLVNAADKFKDSVFFDIAKEGLKTGIKLGGASVPFGSLIADAIVDKLD